MSLKKKLIADLLFGIQIIGAFVLGGSQFFRFLKTTQGQLGTAFEYVSINRSIPFPSLFTRN